jgi:hypothetical protein
MTSDFDATETRLPESREGESPKYYRHALQRTTSADAPVPAWSGPQSSLEEGGPGLPAEPPVDLVACSGPQFHLWLSGYMTGYQHGFERGGDHRDAEWQARHDYARRVVRLMAGLPERKR